MPLSSLFSNPDGSPCEQPCMLGLQPGVTEFNIADERLQAHPFLQGRFKRYADRTSRDLVEYVTTNLRIVITKDGRKLASISLDFDPRLIRRAPSPTTVSPLENIYFGEVVNLLGKPTLITFGQQTFDFTTGRGPDQTWAYYLQDQLVVINRARNLGPDHLHIDDSVTMLLMPAPNSFLDAWKEVQTAPGAAPWLGFGSLRQYAIFNDAKR